MTRKLPESSLEKGLRVLELLNDHVSVRVRDLHDWTGIPKPTLVRILKRLQELGFVRHISRSGGYSVASRVIALSSGFHGTPMIVEQAAPFLDDLTRRERSRLSQYGNQVLTPIFSRLEVLARRYAEQEARFEQYQKRLKTLREGIESA